VHLKSRLNNIFLNFFVGIPFVQFVDNHDALPLPINVAIDQLIDVRVLQIVLIQWILWCFKKNIQ